jgi:hypothetical protein
MTSVSPPSIASLSPDAALNVPPAVIRPTTTTPSYSYSYSPMSGLSPEPPGSTPGTPLLSQPSIVQPSIQRPTVRRTTTVTRTAPQTQSTTPRTTSSYTTPSPVSRAPTAPRRVISRTTTANNTPIIGTPQTRIIPTPGTVTQTTVREPVTYSQPGIRHTTVREPVTYSQPGIRETTVHAPGLHQTVMREPISVTQPGVRETTTHEPVNIPQQAVLETTTSSKVVPPPNYQPAQPAQKDEVGDYLKTPDNCHPGRQPYKCPIAIYVILIVILIIVNIWAIFRAPNFDSSGRHISTGTKWWAGIVGIVFILIFGLFFGWWILQRCKTCDTSGPSSGVTFALALGVPIILGVLAALVIGGIMGVGFLWTASRAPNPTSSDIC